MPVEGGGSDTRARHGGPPPKSVTVSAQMSRMPRKSSGPELALRRLLHARGLRYRTHPRGLPGTPDIAFTRARIAVFVDGCFWHACPEHGVMPKNNAEWWSEKLAKNRARDLKKDRQLLELGWIPVHVWEHEPPDEAANRIAELWRARVGRPS